jgi:hypothetical protein
VKKDQTQEDQCKAPFSSSESKGKSDSSEVECDDAKLALLMKRTTSMLSKIGKKGYNYDPKKQKFGHQEEMVKETIGSATIVEVMIIYHMISPSPTSEYQAQARRTMRMRKMPSTTRSLPRRSHQTSPTTRRRVKIVLSWSMNG